MIIGTAGHIDHGKTSLVRILTGVDTDRLKEEKARGISIDLGFAYLPAPDGAVLGFVDVPGHERFIHNMLAGATGIDFVLLVVAADDGPMPQTREHLAIVELLGIDRGIVALTKADLADDGRREEVEAGIRRMLETTALAKADIVPVSTVTGEGIEGLRTVLLEAARGHAVRNDRSRFRMSIDRSFTLPGAGTVVTGTVLSGAVAPGDRLMVSPSGLPARVRSVHAQNRAAEQGHAGQRCALNLSGEGISKDSVGRGDVVLDPELHAPAGRIDAQLRLLESERRPLGQWTPVRLYHGAAEVGARVVVLADEPIAPAGKGYAQLVLERPIAAAAGDRFVIRDTTARRTLGGGTFLDLRAPARRRRSPLRLAQLAAHALSDAEQALAALLACSPLHTDLSSFARDRALSAGEVDGLVRRLGIVTIAAQRTVLALPGTRWQLFKQDLVASLEAFHAENPDLQGIGLERLRLQIAPAMPGASFIAVIQALVQARDIALDGAWVRLPGHEARLQPADARSWERIRPHLGGADRFRPPRVRDIANLLGHQEPDVRRLFKTLARMGQLDEIAHDRFFLRDSVAEMVAIMVDLASHAQDGQFTAAGFRDRLSNGRKVAIEILEFFDRHGVTLRRGDLRRINKHRLDLFQRHAEGASAEGGDPGRESSPVGRPDFKSGRGRETVLGGFDSLSLPPDLRRSP
jgi:selenocysteine-specific elongation factor